VSEKRFVKLKFSSGIQVKSLRERGVEFLKTPATYYDALKENLKKSKVKVTEDMDKVNFC
jgi:4-hydroxyphenylpyruvate dioxygenase-like putative hemolysin